MFNAQVGAVNYVPELDFNHDGVIDILDANYLSARLGTWIDVGPGINWLVVGGAVIGGLATGFALAKLL